MCGFAGVVAWNDRYRTSREVLSRMSGAIAHRGPDGEGVYFNHEGEVGEGRPQVALAFRRLAILDPDPRAMQPFHLYDDAGRVRLSMVFNGEIYNFRELRRELEGLRPGYAWRTTGDTEVLLVAYDVWGGRCVERLNGMFAVAVWEEGAGSLFLARDRMGQKPLYYAVADGPDTEVVPGNFVVGQHYAVAFASELEALRPVRWIDRTLSDGALDEYLRWGFVPQGPSVYRGIRQVRPSQRCTVFESQRGHGTYYWHTDSDRRRPVFDQEAPGLTRQHVLEAVERQLVSDVPLGVFLSGGVDSSVIAAGARRALGAGQPLMTFSIGFDDPRYDESQYAEAVAKHLGTQHHAFVVKPDAAEDLPKLAAVFGEPFADSSALPTHYLSRETRRFVKVALSGDGGDELFAGYERYRAMAMSTMLRTVATPVPWHVLSPVVGLLPGWHPKSRLTRAKRFARGLRLPPGRRYSSYMRLVDSRLFEALTGRPDERSDWFCSVYGEYSDGSRSVVQRAMAVDRDIYLPDDLLTKVDRASMLHNLEVRSPFMDPDVVTFAAGLTTDQLLKGGPKRMLREAFAGDLPEFVFKRRKMGFAVPIGEWFRGSLRGMLHDHLFARDSFAAGHFNLDVVRRLVREHEEERVDHSQRLYALLMLELWWRLQRRPA